MRESSSFARRPCRMVSNGRDEVDNFLALEITWWEKGNGVMLEAGICACRCRNIDAMVSLAASDS